jgi:hypothetical protein
MKFPIQARAAVATSAPNPRAAIGCRTFRFI